MKIQFKNGDEFEYDLVIAKLECVWIVLRARMVYLINKLNIKDEDTEKAE